MTTPGLGPDVQYTNSAMDQSPNNMKFLKGLNDTLVQQTKASETQMAMLASLKEDILFCFESDEEEEEQATNIVNT